MEIKNTVVGLKISLSSEYLHLIEDSMPHLFIPTAKKQTECWFALSSALFPAVGSSWITPRVPHRFRVPTCFPIRLEWRHGRRRLALQPPSCRCAAHLRTPRRLLLFLNPTRLLFIPVFPPPPTAGHPPPRRTLALPPDSGESGRRRGCCFLREDPQREEAEGPPRLALGAWSSQALHPPDQAHHQKFRLDMRKGSTKVQLGGGEGGGGHGGMEVEDVRVRHHLGHAGCPADGGQHVLEHHYRRLVLIVIDFKNVRSCLEKITNQLLLLQVSCPLLRGVHHRRRLQ